MRIVCYDDQGAVASWPGVKQVVFQPENDIVLYDVICITFKDGMQFALCDPSLYTRVEIEEEIEEYIELEQPQHLPVNA